MKHLDQHNVLVDLQHCFRRKRSCKSLLIDTINDISKRMNDNIQTDAILLDFSKAFDKVPRKNLLLELDHFLSKSSQSVVMDAVTSDTAQVLSGITQVSVLGSQLFLAYINNLPECVSSDTMQSIHRRHPTSSPGCVTRLHRHSTG